METIATCDSSKRDGAPPAAPTTVDDLERRVRVLRESGVRAYKDGPIEIVFEPAPNPISPTDALAAKFAELETAGRREGGEL